LGLINRDNKFRYGSFKIEGQLVRSPTQIDSILSSGWLHTTDKQYRLIEDSYKHAVSNWKELIDETLLYERAKNVVSWGGPKNISMLPIIAEQKGLFSKKDLNTQWLDIQAGKLATELVHNGDLDIGIIVDTNISFIKFQPVNLKVVAVIMEKSDDAIIARKDKGIMNAKQLEGKKVGVTFGTTSHAMTMAYLQSKGVNISKINFVNQPPSDLQSALISGDIDAAALWQPLRFNTRVALKDIAVELQDNPPHKARVLVVVREDYAKTHQKEIAKFLKAMIDAEEYVQKNQQEAQEILSEQVGIPPNVLSASWSEYNLHVFMPKDLLTGIEKQGEWIIATQPEFKQKSLPEYAEALDQTFLKQVKADKVTGF
jgi:ABC-type nitrate/sulfonate/bicarbonate transport system substrate-binding protein